MILAVSNPLALQKNQACLVHLISSTFWEMFSVCSGLERPDVLHLTADSDLIRERTRTPRAQRWVSSTHLVVAHQRTQLVHHALSWSWVDPNSNNALVYVRTRCVLSFCTVRIRVEAKKNNKSCFSCVRHFATRGHLPPRVPLGTTSSLYQLFKRLCQYLKTFFCVIVRLIKSKIRALLKGCRSITIKRAGLGSPDEVVSLRLHPSACVGPSFPSRTRNGPQLDHNP